MKDNKCTIRLMSGGVDSNDKTGEWDKYIVNSPLGNGNDIWNWSGSVRSWSSTTNINSPANRTTRGATTVENSQPYASNTSAAHTGFRPVLEIESLFTPIKKSFLSLSDGYKKLIKGSISPLVYSTSDAVPTMTSNTNGIVTISASGTYNASYAPYECFNDTSLDTTDAWVSADGTKVNTWIKVDFGEVKKIGKYSMKNRGTNEFPSGWKLQGSIDDLNWIDLDIRTSETTLQIASAKTTFINNTSFGDYRYYRILITAFSGSSTYVGIGEIELFEVSIVPTVLPSWQTVSPTLPTVTQFQEEGIDDLSILDRKVQTVMESPIDMTSEVLGIGKVLKTSVNLNKYFDLRKLEVK